MQHDKGYLVYTIATSPVILMQLKITEFLLVYVESSTALVNITVKLNGFYSKRKEIATKESEFFLE